MEKSEMFTRVSYRIWGGGGVSLWGTATVSCMSYSML